MFAHATRTRAFSLIELVIVVVIIGIIAAIAVPRMSRGAAGAADSALTANLAMLRNAVDLFQTEHGGAFPSITDLPNALTQFSNETGTTFSASKTATEYYGPYLRAIPALPVGSNKGLNTFTATLGGAYGWVYDAATGGFKANLPGTEKDVRGIAYNAY